MKIIKSTLSKYVILFLYLLVTCSPASAWLSGWDYRMPIEINNTGNNLTDFQYFFTVDTASLVSAGKMNANGSDCRITNTTDVLQPFWDETAFNNSTTKIWVNAPSLGNVSNTTHYMYYGNSTACYVSNGSNTFSYRSSLIDEWTPYANNPFSVDTVFASRLKVGSTYHAYYSGVYGAKYQINHATSTDGKNWTDDTANNPVLAKGSGGAWDDDELICSWVWIEDSVWYMIYHGRNVADTIEAVGLATSADGITWTKNASNPVFIGTEAWDLNDAENWGVIKVESTYYMWYESAVTGYRQLGLATSTDLTNWTADPNNPIFTSTAGNQKCCPDCFKVGDYYYLLFRHQGPPESIVLYRDTNPTFYPTDREFMGYAHWSPDSGWDSDALDTPFVLTDDICRNSYAASNNELWMYYDGRSTPGFFDAGMTIESDIDAALSVNTSFKYILFDDSEDGVDTWIEDTTYYAGDVAWENNTVKIHSHSTKHFTPSAYSIFYHPLVEKIQTNDRIIEFYIRTNQTNGNVFIFATQGTIHDTNKVSAHVVFRDDGNIQHYDGSYHNIIPYSADTWYRIRLSDIDFTANTFDIWIDGNKEKDNIPFYKSNNLAYFDYIEMELGDAGTNYLDMLLSRKYAATEPTTSLGAEESAPSVAAPSITSWQNNKTNNNSLDITINTSEEVNFNATANQSITTWNWYKDNVDQSHNYDNITLNWSSTGLKYVIVNATNVNGTSSSITWNVTVSILPPTNIQTTPSQTWVNITWDAVPNADNYSVYELEDGFPYVATNPIVDGIKDAVYNYSHEFLIFSPNPVNPGDYETIYPLRTSSGAYFLIESVDNDNKLGDDDAIYYFDLDNDGLTIDDPAWKITNNIVKKYLWDGASWKVTGVSRAVGASTGGGTLYPIHELFIPVAELGANWTNGSTVKVLVKRVDSSFTPDVVRWYPYGNVNDTNTALWQEMVLNDPESYTWLANTTNLWYNATGLIPFTIYHGAVSAWNGSQESSYALFDVITDDIPFYNVSGYIKNQDGNPLPDITVYSCNGFVTEITTTNESGFWIGYAFREGNYTICANSTCYIANSIDIHVTDNMTNQNITLNNVIINNCELMEKLLEIEDAIDDLSTDFTPTEGNYEMLSSTYNIFLLLLGACFILAFPKRGEVTERDTGLNNVLFSFLGTILSVFLAQIIVSGQVVESFAFESQIYDPLQHYFLYLIAVIMFVVFALNAVYYVKQRID